MKTLDPTNPLFENLENNPPDWPRTFVNASKNLINAKVSSVAYGTYYYGSVGSCDLEQMEHKNRCVFDQGNNFILK